MTQSNSILKDSISSLSEDTKFIRLATITTFIHSLLFIIYIIYLLLTFNQFAWWDTLSSLIAQYTNLIAPNTEILVIIIILAIVLAIWYSILPPIWDAAMISYVHSENKSGTLSLSKWLFKFFPMFEFNATMTFFNLLTLWIVVSRLYVMNILNGLTITVLIMRSLFVLLAMIFLPYTKWFITLHDDTYFEAMKHSAGLAASNIWITIKFVVINILLYLRFLINILIVIGIPLLMLRWASKLDFAESVYFQVLVTWTILGLIFLTAYINGIIEAFFITYWSKVFTQITLDP